MPIRDEGPFTLAELSEMNFSHMRGETMHNIALQRGMTRAKLDRDLMRCGVIATGMLVPVGRPLTVEALGEVWEAVFSAERLGCLDKVVKAARAALAEHEAAV